MIENVHKIIAYITSLCDSPFKEYTLDLSMISDEVKTEIKNNFDKIKDNFYKWNSNVTIKI